LVDELKYDQYANDIQKELAKQSEFERLKAEEKSLNMKIKKITDEEKRARDQDAKETDEDKNEIAEKKKTLNEVEVEAKLSIQYFKSQIDGA